MKITGIIVLILVVVAGGYFFLLSDKAGDGVIEVSDINNELPVDSSSDSSVSLEVPAPGSIGVEETVVNNDNSSQNSGASSDTTGNTPAEDTTPTATTPTPDPEPTTPEVTEPETVAPKTVTVNYSSSGYSPKDITISKGDTVRFVSTSGTSNWPASAFHPTHTVYPGSNISKCGTSAKIFDACGVVAAGDSFEFTFNEVGDWKYHNHVSAGRTGTVIVK